MLPLFGQLKEYVKRPDIVIDGQIFRLCCKVTSLALFAFTLITTANMFVGDAIKCLDSKGKETPRSITNWCWMQSTFTLPYSPARMMIEEDYQEERRYHQYYQWVAFTLLLQGVMCYLPKFLWNAWENKIMEKLVGKSNKSLLVQKERDDRKLELLRYLLSHERVNRFYAFDYFMCEILCLALILGQIVGVDTFLNGEFYEYGFNVISFLFTLDDRRVDPMIYVFPKTVKCEFHKVGPSGSIVNLDALCILAINNINEKIYIVMWLWFVVLTALLSLLLGFRLLIVFSISTREILIRSIYPRIKKDTAATICRCENLGNFWMIYLLGFNIPVHFYHELLEELAAAIKDDEVRDRILSAGREAVDDNKGGGKGDCVVDIDKIKQV